MAPGLERTVANQAVQRTASTEARALRPTFQVRTPGTYPPLAACPLRRGHMHGRSCCTGPLTSGSASHVPLQRACLKGLRVRARDRCQWPAVCAIAASTPPRATSASLALCLGIPRNLGVRAMYYGGYLGSSESVSCGTRIISISAIAASHSSQRNGPSFPRSFVFLHSFDSESPLACVCRPCRKVCMDKNSMHAL
jgi:hypothetical protein